MAARVHGYANGTDLLLAFSPNSLSGDGCLPEDHKFSSGDSVTVCRGNPQVGSRCVHFALAAWTMAANRDRGVVMHRISGTWTAGTGLKVSSFVQTRTQFLSKSVALSTYLLTCLTDPGAWTAERTQ